MMKFPTPLLPSPTRRRSPRAWPLALLLATTGCVLALPGDGNTTGEDEFEPPPSEPIPGYPVLDKPCTLGVETPARLLVTTTDFATGAVSVVDTRNGAVQADVALSSTDALPFFHQHESGHAYLLHRFMIDALDVLDTTSWATLSQQAIEVPDDRSANAHSVAFSSDGRAYVTLFGAPRIHVYSLDDPSKPTRDADVPTIDLTPVADADGNPEASLSIVCGDTLFVSLGLLDENALFAPTTEHDALVAIDRVSGQLYDLDPDEPGVQTLEILGQWARQWRLDPANPAGHTVLVLSTGIERINLLSGAREWAVTPETFAAAGILHHMQPQAFALADGAAQAFVASYTSGFASVTIDVVGLDGRAPQQMTPLVTGVSSVERVLERVGSTLWYGDTTPGHAGIQGLDLSTDPPTPVFDAPRSVGLAPYSMIAIP